MDLEVEIDGVVVAATADDDGLRVRVGEQRYEALWDEVVAGWAPHDEHATEGPGRVFLALARRSERRDGLVVPLPGDDDDVAAFVAEIRRRAGSGWIDDAGATSVAAPPSAAAPPWGLAVIALVIAGIVSWQLLDAGHLGSPFTATVVTVVLAVTFLALVRLRTRR